MYRPVMPSPLLRTSIPADAVTALRGAAYELDERSQRAVDPGTRLTSYKDWVSMFYEAIRRHVGTARTEALIHSRFYWHAVTMVLDNRAMGDLYEGMRLQAVPFRELADEIEGYTKVYQPKVGWVTAVVDTSALGVMQPPWQLPMPKMIDAPKVRLVLPLRVLEELDEHKYGETKQIHKVARSFIPDLERLLTEENGTRAIVNDDFYIDVVIPPGVRVRPPHADAEILETAEDLRQFGNQDVVVVADDISMRVQARARQLRAIPIENGFRRARVSPAPVE